MPKSFRRNLISITALLLLALVAAACGGAQQPTALPEPTPTAAPEAADVWQTVQQRGKIVVGTSADYPPFAFYNEKFQIDGFDVALMQAIGERLGVEVEFNDFAFDGLGHALVLGQIDVAIAAISVTPERQELVDFSDIYYVGAELCWLRPIAL